MRWGSAGSDAPEMDDAIERVSEDLRAKLEDGPIDLVVAFVSHHFADRYLEFPSLLSRALPHRVLVGCSAGGVIGGGREIERRPGISVTAARLPEVDIRPVHVEGSDLPDLDDRPGTWVELLETPQEPAPHFLVFAEPFSFPAPVLLSGLDYAYPKSVKVGGLASGAAGPGGNALFIGEEIRRAGAVVVSLSGAIAVETIVAQGCRPIGRPLRITRCSGNLLFELEGKTPLDTAREVIGTLPEGERALAGRALFLGVAMNEMVERPGPGDFLIRNLVGMDPETGAFAIGETLRVGQTVQFHVRDAGSAAEELTALLGEYGRQPNAGALLFSCNARGTRLFSDRHHDARAIADECGRLPVAGLFCAGEIGP
ncbi:MAG: hypothetical protein EHM19_07545, partial [Candidatus Latescibacterota bacterium]